MEVGRVRGSPLFAQVGTELFDDLTILVVQVMDLSHAHPPVLEEVSIFEILDQRGVYWLPPKPLAGQRARRRVVY